MNWTQFEGKWAQMKGTLRSKWSKLTNDDLGNLAGKRDQLAGKIVERYGVAKDEAERQLDSWLATLDEEPVRGQHPPRH